MFLDDQRQPEKESKQHRIELSRLREARQNATLELFGSDMAYRLWKEAAQGNPHFQQWETYFMHGFFQEEEKGGQKSPSLLARLDAKMRSRQSS